MDKDKILRLCNEIEDIATEIQKRTMKDSYFMTQPVINKVHVISEEINEPPKTNGDKIRHMTDEELAEYFMNFICDNLDPIRCRQFNDCTDCVLAWLIQETQSNDG